MAYSVPTLNREHIRPGDRICAAVSGGADSIALLLLLHAENSTPRNALGIGLSAVHVHHGLRGEEADADLAFVEDLCKRLEVPLHIHHASVPDRLIQAREQGRAETTEEAARILRYDFFRSLITEGHATAVLTAHTLDDQAETVLMKLLRGAWTEGLSGIHPVVLLEPVVRQQQPGRIVRPLLQATRAELRAYLNAHAQPWREDSSNADHAHTRNRLRHTVLPLLRQENPSIDRTLANLATLAREEEARWSAELSRILPQLLLPGKPVRGGGRSVATSSETRSVAIELERLRPLDVALQRRVLRAAARTLGVRLTFEETARLLTFTGLSTPETGGAAPRTGSRIDLAPGLKAERSPRELRLYAQ